MYRYRTQTRASPEIDLDPCKNFLENKNDITRKELMQE